MSKKERGLKVKNLDWFNRAILGKWKWRVIKGRDSLRVRVLKSRYGPLDVVSPMVEGSEAANKMCSWWKNICQDASSSSSLDWFREGLNRRIGKGDKTKFWKDKWFEIHLLK